MMLCPVANAASISDETDGAGNRYLGSFGAPLTVYSNVQGTFYIVGEDLMGNATINGVTATLENASRVGSSNLSKSAGEYSELLFGDSSKLSDSQIDTSAGIVSHFWDGMTQQAYNALPDNDVKKLAAQMVYSTAGTIEDYLNDCWQHSTAINADNIALALEGDYATFNSHMGTSAEWDQSVSITNSTLTLNGTSAIVNRAQEYPGTVSISDSTIIANGTNSVIAYTTVSMTKTGATKTSLLQVNNGSTLTISSDDNRISLTNTDLTVNGTITGNVSLEGTGVLSGTGAISGNLNVAASSVLKMHQNDAIDTITAGTVTGGNFSIALDVNAAGGAIDHFTATSFTTGTITISALNFLSAEQNFALNVLDGNLTGTTLVLSSDVSTAYNTSETIEEWRNNLATTATWATTFTKTRYTIEISKSLTVLNNKMLSFTITNGAETPHETVSLGDTVALLNTMESSTRTMTNSTSAASYTVTENLGTTAAGTFTINGAKADSSAATINMGGHTGFSVGNNAILNLRNIVFNGNTADAGSVLTIAGGTAGLSNVTIGNVVSVTSGTLTLSGGNALGGLANAGTVTLTGANSVGAISGTGTLTNNGNLTLTGTTNGQTIGGTGRTYIDAALTTTAAINQAITINSGRTLTTNAGLIGGAVTNGGTLSLTEGTLGQAVSGGTVQINGDVTSNVLLANTTITEGGTLRIGAGDVGANLTNDGTLALSGGTLTRTVSGTVQINGNVTSNVLLSNATISDGNRLTIAAGNVGANLVNYGELVLQLGTLNNGPTGTGTIKIDGNVLSNVALSNVTVNSGKKLTISANNIGENITNNGTLALSGGTLTRIVSGTVLINGNVTSNVSLTNAATTINSGKRLRIGAGNIGENLTNNGTLVLSGGILTKTVSGAIEIDGIVRSDVSLSDATVNNGKQLTIAANNVEKGLTNNGTVVLTNGTLINALSGAGNVRISGNVVSETPLSNVTIDPDKTLTLAADNVGSGYTNNGTVVLTGGEISKPLSGKVTVTNYTEMKNGADFSGAQINLTEGILDIGTKTLTADTLRGGTVSLSLKEYAAAETLVTTAPSETVTLEVWPFDVTNKSVQHYTLTSTDNGYSLDFILQSFFAVSTTPFDREQAMDIAPFDASTWTGGDLYVVALNVAEVAVSELSKSGYKVTTNDKNTTLKLSDDLEDILTGQYQDNYQKVNMELLSGFIDEDYGRVKAILAEAGTDTTPATAQTAKTNAQAVMSVVSSRLGGGSAVKGRSGGDFVAGDSTVWAQGLLNRAKLNGDNGFNSRSNGFAAGYEYNIDDSYKAGAGYAFTATDINTDRGKTKVDTHTFFVYGEYKPDKFFVNGSLGYGRSTYDEKTRLLGLQSDYKANTLSVQAMSGYALDYFTPEAGIRYTKVKEKAYTDALGAKTADKNLHTLTAVAGIKTTKDFRLEKGVLTAQAGAALTYDLKQGSASKTVSMANGTNYVVQGKNMKRAGFELSADVSYQLNAKTDIGLSYEGKFKEKYSDHTLMLNVRYAF